jgi:transposase
VDSVRKPCSRDRQLPMRYAITDEIWDVMGPMVERCKSRLGPPPELPDRMFFEAVLYWARTACPWRDLPGDFGQWSAVYKRLRRWIDSGRLERLFRLMAARPACEGTLRVMIDSTIVRAHQHAAGAVKKKGGTAGNAIGRSRGGPSTKIIAVAIDEDGVVAVDVAGGQRNDAPLAPPVLAEAKAAVGRIDEVLGDKGFDSDKIRDACLDEHDALPVIPNKKNRKVRWPWDEVMQATYKERNRVERAFSKGKQFRRFATRYEKLKEVFLGVVRLLFGFIHVKKTALSVNTP